MDKRKFAKCNFLISSGFNASLFDMRIVNACLYELQQGHYEDSEFGVKVTLTANQIRDLCKINSGRLYEIIDKSAKHLMNVVYGLSNKNSEEFEYINLISKCSYGNGVFSLIFNGALKDTLLNNQFADITYTWLSLNVTNLYKRESTLRLYELLKRRGYLANATNEYKVNLKMSELLIYLGYVDLSNEKVAREYKLAVQRKANFSSVIKEAYTEGALARTYLNLSDIKRKILEPVVKEINNTPGSDINIEYAVRLEDCSKKVDYITFYVKSSNNKKEAVNFASCKKVIDLLSDYNITNAQARELYEVAGGNIEKILYAKKVVDQYKQKNSINNPSALIKKAIACGWKVNVTSEKGNGNKVINNRFHNYSQREYPKEFYDKLENSLLGKASY